MAAPKAKLNDEQKMFIVRQLACFEGPSAIVKALKADYGIEVTRQAIENYNPELAAGAGKKWLELFKATRKAFLADHAQVGIAHRSVRLRKLDRMATEAEQMRNYALVAQLLEQAAKECGDSYTNRQKVEHTGKDGGPIQTVSLSPEERQARMQELLNKHPDLRKQILGPTHG